MCLAFTAAAYLVYRRRTPRGAERRLWQIMLAAYAVMTLSVFGDYFTPWMDQMFILGVVAMLVIGIGGIALGIMMLRNGFRPRATPILLMSFIPFMFAITSVTSLGSALLPLMWGWAIAAQTVVNRPGTRPTHSDHQHRRSGVQPPLSSQAAAARRPCTAGCSARRQSSRVKGSVTARPDMRV